MKTKILDLILLTLFCAVTFFALSCFRPLANPDEGRYVEIPTEMVASGDYVTPTLNGMPYFYKPPMFYWMQAASIKTFGSNIFAWRFANSAVAIFGVLLTYLAVSLLYNRKAGIFAGLVLATSNLYYALGQVIVLDTTVSVFISGALFSFMLFYFKDKFKPLYILAFFVFCALAVLTKGLIGVLIPCAVIFLFLLFCNPVKFVKNLKKSEWLALFFGAVLFLAIALPWHILAAIATPAQEGASFFSKDPTGQGFLWYYIMHEHFLRYIDSSTSMRYQPFWFFFVFAPIGLLPWLPAFIQSLFYEFKGGIANFVKNNKKTLFLFVWVAFVLLFFSISKSKLIPYIIPVYPALAVVVGAFLDKVLKGSVKRPRASLWAIVALGFIATIALPIVCYVINAKGRMYMPEISWYVFSAASFAVLIPTLVGMLCLLKNNVKAALYSAFIGAGIFTLCFNPVAALIQRPSSADFAKCILADKDNSGAKIVLYRNYNEFQDMPVYTKRFVYLVNTPPDEQLFGYNLKAGENAKRFLTESDFKKLVESGEALWIVSRNRDLTALNLKGEGVKLAAKNYHSSLFFCKRPLKIKKSD